MFLRILAVIAHFAVATTALTLVINETVNGIGAVGLVVFWGLNVAGMVYQISRSQEDGW